MTHQNDFSATNHLVARHHLVQATKDFIARHRLLAKGDRVIVGLSGGADSVALCLVLQILGYDVQGAHANFGLRGAESMRDQMHVARVAQLLDIDLHLRRFDVDAQCKATGQSVEMACRELRYTWFTDLLEQLGAHAIAVAHHREDNVETFLLNVLRGTGIMGLGGMQPRRDHVIRPFLPASRAQIEDLLRVAGIDFVTDSSNLENHYLRNRLRNVVLPAIVNQFGPGAMDSILNTIGMVASHNRLYRLAVDNMAHKYLLTTGEGFMAVDVGAIAALERVDVPFVDDTPFTLLRYILVPYGFTPDNITTMLRAVKTGATGKEWRSALGYTAMLSQGLVTLYPENDKVDENTYEVNLRRDILKPVHIRISRHDVSEFEPRPGQNNVLYLDMRVLDATPGLQILDGLEHTSSQPLTAKLRLRHPRNADRIAPFGMKGSRLVSDILAEANLDAYHRQRVWVLERDSDQPGAEPVILWIVGHRASRHYTIGPRTQAYLRLELEGAK